MRAAAVFGGIVCGEGFEEKWKSFPAFLSQETDWGASGKGACDGVVVCVGAMDARSSCLCKYKHLSDIE